MKFGNSVKKFFEFLLKALGLGLGVAFTSAAVHEMTGLSWGWSVAALLALIAYHQYLENEKKKKLFQEMLDEALKQAHKTSLRQTKI